jgi:hypothetical protein
MIKLTAKLVITISIITFLCTFPSPKAKAMEPISMSIAAAILLPIAIEVAKEAYPYVLQGGYNFLGGMGDLFVDTAGIFLLPLGLLETTFLGPFGFFTDGLRNMGKGIIAPFKMTWSTVMLPVRIFTG